MLVDDYTPTKRLGVEEMEGLQAALERRIDAAALDGTDATPRAWREEGAWLAVHLLLTCRFRTQEDFLQVFDVKSDEIFGK